jgi:CHASE1-domain containing sensor protein
MLAGLAATAFVTREVSLREEERFQGVLAEQAHTRGVTIRGELDSVFQALESLRAFFASSRLVSREEFGRFAAGILRAHRSIRALEWAPRVGEELRVRYIEPPEGNHAAVGYDLNSDPLRREALRRAMRGDRLAATGRVTFVQEAGKAAGILIVGPVKGGGRGSGCPHPGRGARRVRPPAPAGPRLLHLRRFRPREERPSL